MARHLTVRADELRRDDLIDGARVELVLTSGAMGVAAIARHGGLTTLRYRDRATPVRIQRPEDQ